MTQEEIIAGLIDRLDFHLDGASVHQNPYKNEIFKLFREAYRRRYFESYSSPRLTGDALRETLQVRWDTGGTAKVLQRHHLMEAVLIMWDEWRYAWEHYP
jgi:hypothetical protein